MCIAVISDLCDDVVKYVRGGDTDITFGRLVFFFRRGIEFPSSWLLTRLALPTFDNSPRLPFKTDGTKLDQDSIQLETALQSQFSPPLSSSSSSSLLSFLFIYFFLLFSSCLRFFSIPLVPYSLLYSTRFSTRRKEKMKKSATQRRPFFCGRAW